MNPTDPKKIGIFLDWETHRRLRVQVSRHGLTNQEALFPCIKQRIEELENTEPQAIAPSPTNAIAS